MLMDYYHIKKNVVYLCRERKDRYKKAYQCYLLVGFSLCCFILQQNYIFSPTALVVSLLLFLTLYYYRFHLGNQ